MRWRGSFKAAVHNVHDDAVKILPHLISRNAQCFYPLTSNPIIACFVTLGIVSEFMRKSVDFNCEACSLAKEVENEWTERMLPSEMQPARAQLKRSPKPDL